jgi:hypothetical protein
MKAADPAWKPINFNTIYRYLSGDLLLPPSLAERIAPHLGCTVDELLVEVRDADRPLLSTVGLGVAPASTATVTDLLKVVGVGPGAGTSTLKIKVVLELNGKPIRSRVWSIVCRGQADAQIIGEQGTEAKDLELSPIRAGKPRAPVSTRPHALYKASVASFSADDIKPATNSSADSPAGQIRIQELLLAGELNELLRPAAAEPG